MHNPFMNSHLVSSVKKRVMVVSAKGGVGKSTTTVNLAAAMVASGLKVGIFDADVHGPNIPALLGIRRKHDVADDPTSMVTIQAKADSPFMRPVRPFERYGILLTSLALLVGDTQIIQPQVDVVGDIMTFMLRQVDWGGADVLLIDMPPGTGEPLASIAATGMIDGVIVVATRERLAHLDNGRLLSFLRRRAVPVLGIVENMTHVICPNCGEAIELYPSPVEDMREVYGDSPILASLPFHPNLIRQTRGSPPLAIADSEAEVSRILMDLAGQVMAKLN